MFIVGKIRFKNFRSWGNQWTEIDLLRSATTVITARNGAGKTSILYAIMFALFGKVPKINKNKLINDINNRDCLVEIECNNNGQEILIRRGMKPNVFDIIIDGKLIDQSASSRDYQAWLEETVIGFNISSFQQVVSISGSNYTPFFLLTTGIRRAMVEDLLSITVFSKMYAIHTGMLNSLKERIQDTEKDIEKYTESIASLKKGLNELSSRDADLKQITLDRIKQTQDKIKTLVDSKAALRQSIDDTDFTAIEHSKIKTKLKKMGDISGDITKTKKSNLKFIDFLNSNSTCPTCANDLTEEFKENHICTKEAKNAELDEKQLELNSLIETTQVRLDELIIAQGFISNTESRIRGIETEIEFLNKEIQRDENSLKNVDSRSDTTLKDDIIQKSALLNQLKTNKTDLLVDRQYLDLQSQILKDSGIKSRIINQIVPRMTKDINHYLNLMELGASFEIDENFNETIYRRHKDPTDYVSLSAGERARVDISVLFTWREIAKAKNSLSCNLLFLDEIFDNTLDIEGLELFTNLLKNHLPDTNVFLISHKPEVVDKFESNLRIEKRGNFSQIL